MRRQVRPARKPLVALTPKSLLSQSTVSTLEELCDGEFQTVLDEIDDLNPKKVTRLVLYSGKMFYDLLEARREAECDTVAIIRLEQLYPFPEDKLAQLDRYLAKAAFGVKEPMNQGAWYSSQHHIRNVLQQHIPQLLSTVMKPTTPAAGSPGLHIEQQQQLVQEAFGDVNA